MDRHNYPKVVPVCPGNLAIVDQYEYDHLHKDTNEYPCVSGAAMPIYDCTGAVNFSLPLEKYPAATEIHPDLYLHYATRTQRELGGSVPGPKPSYLRMAAPLAGRSREELYRRTHEKYGALPPGRPLDARAACPYGTVAGSCKY